MDEPTELVGARLPKELVELARKIGHGNLSAGIRQALERYNHRKPTQDEIDAAIATLAQMQDGEATP